MALDKNAAKLTDNEADKVTGGTESNLSWVCIECRYSSLTEYHVCPNCGSTEVVQLCTLDDDMLNNLGF